MRRRVVITGVGTVSPLGLDAPTTWERLLEGRSGIGPITKFDATGFASTIAGEVRGFDPTDYMEKKEARKMDSFTHYAIAATEEALEDAGFRIDESNDRRVGVYIGSGIGGLPLMEEQFKVLHERGPRRITPFLVPGMILNLAAGQVSIRTGAKGPNLAIATACATGTHAIGESFRLIKDGYADAMISGGTESSISPLPVAGFCAMKALSTNNDEPEKASKPFDLNRDGFVIGEGAGIMLLEEYEAARSRGARIYAEVTGYGMSGDAFHVSAPSDDGDGAVRSMRIALQNASLEPRDVDYINAHGTATPAGDRIEVLAVRRVFGEHADSLAVSSSKSMTGHLLGAAGGLEAIITAKAVFEDVAPPTINLTEPDPECDLDFVPGRSRKMKVRAAMSNSFGFGGTNATIVLSKCEE